ncbi:hypothetical protein [Clavibacter michiganensis]|uniref:hypothetical protein n=1 Tax=Clavibacter michiganensis TaxID=28447 RepID=UPI00292F13AD|nr:hypothetical protein [Clavibacter michiganensis]
MDGPPTPARVVARQRRTHFRGLDVPEAVLIVGPVGWTGFSPLVGYDDAGGGGAGIVGLRAGKKGGARHRGRGVRVDRPVGGAGAPADEDEGADSPLRGRPARPDPPRR